MKQYELTYISFIKLYCQSTTKLAFGLSADKSVWHKILSAVNRLEPGLMICIFKKATEINILIVSVALRPGKSGEHSCN